MTKLTRRNFIALAAAGAVELALGGSARAGDLPRAIERKNMNTGITVESTAPSSIPDSPEGLVRLDYISGVDGIKDWAMVRPSESKVWMVVIHGHGSHGDQLYTRPDIKQMWLPVFLGHKFGILTPNLRDNAWMCPSAAEDLHSLLNYVREKYGAERFIFASGSMGGTSNLIYPVLHSEDVSGVVALCPATDLTLYHAWCRRSSLPVCADIANAIQRSYGGTSAEQPSIYSAHSTLRHPSKLSMPVYIAHGTADEFIPVSQPRRLVSEMGESTNFAYIEIPDGGHDAPLARCKEGLDWVIKRLG